MAHDDFTPVDTPQDAQVVARLWAVDRELSHRDFRQFATDWFEATAPENRVRLHLRTTLATFVSVCKHYETTWDRSATLLADQTSNWNLETVKHLAVFNVAGIAGAAALLTNSTYLGQITTKLALPFFAIGLIFSLFTFWTNTRGYASAQEHAFSQRFAAGTARQWVDIPSLFEGHKGKFKPHHWFEIAERTGWSSAVCGVVGVTNLAISLL